MPEIARLAAQIENAAAALPSAWPLRTMIAVNPLQGLEHLPFEAAVQEGAALFGGRAWPAASVLRHALAEGRIDPAVLEEVAARHGRPDLAAGTALDGEAATTAPAAPSAPPSAVNRLLVKWLAAFLDEGQAAWPMPHRELGFWRAFRRVAAHDPEIPGRARLGAMPDEALAALLGLLAGVPDAGREALLTAHLAALPGWSAHVKWRAGERTHPWRRAAPVTLADLLAVRLSLAALTGEGIAAPSPGRRAGPAETAAAIWVEAWEESWRRGLTRALVAAPPAPPPAAAPAAAQLVFCIDVRSEVLRRHLERTGPWRTLGFAGFFGAPVAFAPLGAEAPYASCPVLLEPKHVVAEAPAPGAEAAAAGRLRGLDRLRRLKGGLRALKESVAGSFGFVEATGAVFGGAMVARTLAPAGTAALAGRLSARLVPEAPTAPRLGFACDDPAAGPTGLAPAEQAMFAEGALRVMGLTEGFAPLVLLVGHGGEAVNNPFAAGLDCGACGGNRGGPNARIMAAVLNAPEVRAALAQRGIAIPEETVFVAAEHNTTTDAVTLFDAAAAEARHGAILGRLRADLAAAGRAAASERLGRLPGADSGPARRARDWAELRPEWALARNAGFVVADRALTAGLDLEGRCFLHSYDWRADAEGRALEVILTAPMVVAQWINSQYWFSTTDNAVYGAGSKATQTVVGGFGVMQGNGSDLMHGLPAQSVLRDAERPYHEPLRLMAVVQAPVLRVEEVIARNTILQRLFGNGWVALMVVDPETGRLSRRTREGAWLPAPGPEAPVLAQGAPAAMMQDTGAAPAGAMPAREKEAMAQ